MPETAVRSWVNYAWVQLWIVQLRNPRQQNLIGFSKGIQQITGQASHWTQGSWCFLAASHTSSCSRQRWHRAGSGGLWSLLKDVVLTQHCLILCGGEYLTSDSPSVVIDEPGSWHRCAICDRPALNSHSEGQPFIWMEERGSRSGPSPLNFSSSLDLPSHSASFWPYNLLCLRLFKLFPRSAQSSKIKQPLVYPLKVAAISSPTLTLSESWEGVR